MYMLAGGGARIRNTSSSRERQPEATMLIAALIASLASRSAAIGGCDTTCSTCRDQTVLSDVPCDDASPLQKGGGELGGVLA